MMKKRTKLIIACGILAALVLGAGGAALLQSKEPETEIISKETEVKRGNLTVGVTESGSVVIGAVEQKIDFDALGSSDSGLGTANSGSSNALEVEEVYVAVGQNVAVGDALLKITEESIMDYRKELEAAVSDANAALSKANLSAKQQKLSAQYSYNSNVASGSVAQAEYENTLQELQNAVDSAQTALEQSAAKLADYKAKIDAGEDYYSKYFEEQDNYKALETKLATAKNEQTTKAVEAEKKYQEAMLNYNTASNQYAVDVNGIDTAVETAQEALEEAQEDLADFEAFVGDGVIYSEYDGAVLSVGYAAGDRISSDTAAASFKDTDAITMTVSVSQEDISQVALGDKVNIELTAYEDTVYEGVVESIETSSASGSSTVAYNVTVAFTGETTGIYGDMTGNVTFITKQVEDVIYVSNKAIMNEGIVSYVDVKREDGTVEKTAVETGFSDGINVEIISGLQEGDVVLIESRVNQS